LKYDFTLTFNVDNEYRLSYVFKVPKAFNEYTNFLELKFASPQDEEIYGMGL